MKSKALLWFALLILICGWVTAGVIGWRTVKQGTGLILVPAPGAATVELKHPGPHTIYDEFQGVLDGQYYFREGPMKGMRVELMEVATSRPLQLTPADPGKGYRLGSRRSGEVVKFDAPAAGNYRLVSVFTLPSSMTQTILAIGDGTEHGVKRGLVTMWTVTLLTTVVAGLIALFAVIRKPF